MGGSILNLKDTRLSDPSASSLLVPPDSTEDNKAYALPARKRTFELSTPYPGRKRLALGSFPSIQRAETSVVPPSSHSSSLSLFFLWLLPEWPVVSLAPAILARNLSRYLLGKHRLERFHLGLSAELRFRISLLANQSRVLPGGWRQIIFQTCQIKNA